MDPIYDIVDFIEDLGYDDLPQEVVQLVKWDLLDFCGNTMAGSADPSVRRAAELYEGWGGTEEATVLLDGRRLPAVHAALINGAKSFAVDFDDTHMQGGHIGAAVFPAALAAAEIRGGVSGCEFIAAAAGAMEFMVRLGVYNARRVERHIFGGWEYHGLHAGFAAAAAAGRLLGLDREKMLNAMGIAYYQASGTGLAALEHADTKLLGPGLGARDGLTAVFMARSGMTGAHNVLGGDYGLGSMYHSGCDGEGMVSELGRRWEMLNIGFKPYASCRLGHRTLAAIGSLVRENGIVPEETERVDIMCSHRVMEQLYDPAEVTKHPKTRSAAVFSLPWAVASLIGRGRVGPSELSEEALGDARTLALAQRVFAEVNPATAPSDHSQPQRVSITTRRGVFEALTPREAPGDRGSRMTQEELEQKYWDNAALCAKAMEREKKSAILELANGLESCSDVAELVGLIFI